MSKTQEIIDQARQLISVGQSEHALELLESVQKDHVQHHAFCYELACLLIDADRFAEAKSHLEFCVQSKPTNEEYHGELGCCLFYLDDVKGAKKHTREAIKINPRLSGFHYNLSRFLKHEGLYNKAKKAAIEALRLDPKNDDYKELLLQLRQTQHQNSWKTSLYEPEGDDFSGFDPRFRPSFE